jgi:2-oxo-4-hydroxy-4-carboxy-5-ureidoimidazoline decarboxylase
MIERRSIETVNQIDQATFVESFGDIAEHSPWVAAKACIFRPYKDVDDMIAAFGKVVLTAEKSLQLDLICAHPDLAGKAAIAGELAQDSASEQAQAGIDNLSKEEFATFNDFNNRYKDRFGFPFILAVKGATKDQILASFAERIDNEHDTEFSRALNEICRIIRFRLEARIKS